MNIPFFGKYGTKYGPSSGASWYPGATDPGNTGDFVSVATEDARASVHLSTTTMVTVTPTSQTHADLSSKEKLLLL